VTSAGAPASLVSLVYSELRRLAACYLTRERPGHTLAPTALVHEAYLRLAAQSGFHWESRAQFFSAAAITMRRVLVDYARSRTCEKRFGNDRRVDIDNAQIGEQEKISDILAVDQALTRLAAFDPLQARVVQMRYFTGLSVDETAAALRISPATVKREWALARAWLSQQLTLPTSNTARQ